jgi:hypothetical protein
MPGRRWLPRPAAPCRHGHHLRRLCGLARLLARPTHTDLNGAELESTVPGILPNLGANARVTPPAAASSRRASAAGSPWRPRREGQLCSTASRQPWRRSRDDEREVDAMVEEAGSWRAQPSRTPSQRLGARRERATERDREDGAEQSRRSYSLVSAGEIDRSYSLAAAAVESRWNPQNWPLKSALRALRSGYATVTPATRPSPTYP